MPDEPHLFEYLTVAEHLRLIARLYAVEDFERRSRALLGELELTGKEDSLPGELSRGMRQKVVIACGLIRSATTLLFDEPLTGLDPLGIRRMRETITSRAREGAAILLSSHLLHLVEEVCTRVMIMDRGRRSPTVRLTSSARAPSWRRRDRASSRFFCGSPGTMCRPPSGSC
jgi:ABC-2 type transport system ATP-binding protein